MKKIYLFSFALLALAACKKDNTCNCTYKGESFYKINIRDTKANAKKSCDERKASFSYKGEGTDCVIE